MPYSISKIQKILAVKTAILAEPQAVVEQLLIDSRQIIEPQTSLFFAMRGLRNDGHDFIEPLLERGVRSFVVERFFEKRAAELAVRWPSANFLFVEKSLDSLQKLAAFHRKQVEIPVVGLTGSNGKTVVKEFIKFKGQSFFIKVGLK